MSIYPAALIGTTRPQRLAAIITAYRSLGMEPPSQADDALAVARAEPGVQAWSVPAFVDTGS